MNETQKQAEPTMEKLREAIAEELRAMKVTEDKNESAGQELPRQKKDEETGRLSIFHRAETLAQLMEELGELRETAVGLERELVRLREELDETREQARKTENELRRENQELRQTVQELQETDALIHMRLFDNRVRISELREAWEEAKA